MVDTAISLDPPHRADPTVLHNTSVRMRHAWHAVARSEEVGTDPVQVWLLGQPWVLVRIAGRLLGYVDRCPHRLAPLSLGKVTDGVLACGYHGWRFDAAGACVAIPALGKTENISKRAAVPTPHGLVERYGLVWLAPEEPLAPFPVFDEWDAPGFDQVWATIVRSPTSAAQLVDNFLDAAHFPFVHAATFGTDEAEGVTDDGIVRDGWTTRTTFSTWYKNRDDPAVETGEHELVQPQELTKVGYAAFTVYLKLFFPVTGSTISILFVCQPESAQSTRIYKLMARDDLAGDQNKIAAFIKDEDDILAEDLAILDHYPHRQLSLVRQVEMHTKADRLSLGWRDLIAAMPD